MTEHENRIAELTRRGAVAREALADSVDDISGEIGHKRAQWKLAGTLAGGLAAAGTVAWKLFGPFSAARRIGRATSVASLGLGLVRAFVRLRRYL